MKLFLLILLYLSQSFAYQDNAIRPVRKFINYVKARGIGLLNSRRESFIKPVCTNKPNISNYTVFPPVNGKVFLNVPDSPIFSLDQIDVKKHSQGRPLRFKRAAETTKKARLLARKKSSMKRKSKIPKKKRLRNSERKQAKRSRSKQPSRRLIAGRDAKIEDYPYVVSIQKDKQHWCSGALLNPKLVITTANCVWKSDTASHLRVRAGSRYTDRGGQVASIQEVAKHPMWSLRRNPNFDVALLLLDRNFKFSDALHAADLPNVEMSPPFEDAWVTSWGADRRDGVFPTKGMTLQVVHMNMMDLDKCNNITQRFGVAVTRQFICLAQTGRQAPCTRDTGAPAVSDGVVWGVASWGLRKLCGTERFPAMFSYIASDENMDFIKNTTRYLMSDNRYDPFPDKFVLKPAAVNIEKPELTDEY